jgi:protein disulfide-isomerase
MIARAALVFLLLLGFTPGARAADEWLTNYDQALVTAKAENKRVLLDFTGSDWCGPCIALKKRVFSDPAFAEYAARNLVLVEVDFPNKKTLPDAVKQQNQRLSRQFGIEDKGFPTIVVLGPDGKTLGELSGYRGEGAAEFIAKLDKLR